MNTSLLAGRYRALEQIGTGGMGDVYRATDEVLDRSVALKVLRADLARDPSVRERFRREALTAASLSHPAIAAVYDFVDDDVVPAIVMELVDGMTLAQRLQSGPLDHAFVRAIGVEAAGALETAHARGIVHRDIKPSNIMIVPRGGIKVMDFGIARTASHATLTDTGAVIGTPHYLAPEQVRGEPATPASDLYSLGAVLYEAATGRRPFEAESATAAAISRLGVDPTPPHAYRPDIPQALETTIMRALAREPHDRFATASQMRAALLGAPAVIDLRDPPTMVLPEPIAPTEVIEGAPAPVPPPRRRTNTRRRREILMLVSFLIALGVFAAWAAARPGPVAVPSVIGLPSEDAQRIVREAGLAPHIVAVVSFRTPGLVAAQSPDPRKVVKRGTTVTLSVSTGPPRSQVPNLTGLPMDLAQQRLDNVHLSIGRVIYEPSNRQQPGTVLGTDPGAFTSVPQGSKVDIFVAEPEHTKGGKDKGKHD